MYLYTCRIYIYICYVCVVNIYIYIYIYLLIAGCFAVHAYGTVYVTFVKHGYGGFDFPMTPISMTPICNIVYMYIYIYILCNRPQTRYV